MSLAYKLWKIGSALTEEDVKSSIMDNSETNGEVSYFNIEFTVEDGQVKSIRANENAVSKDRIFFTKKIGGSGTGIYYLYPNLNLQKSILKDKLFLIKNSLNESIMKFCNSQNAELCRILSKTIQYVDQHIERAVIEADIELYQSENNEEQQENNEPKLVKRKEDLEKQISVLNEEDWNDDLLRVSRAIISKEKDDYWFWFSVNGKTFWELMPEVWGNWFKCPVIKNDNAKEGYDVFANKLTDIGYRPEIKIFSYDNYHDSLNFRINENLSLSLESARKIKFAWMYILEHLVFYYKGLEYIIMPNLLSDNQEAYSIILKRLKLAKTNTLNKSPLLKSLAKQEDRLSKELKEVDKKLKKGKDNDLLSQRKQLQQQVVSVEEEIKSTDLGIISEFNEQINQIGELKDSITVDYLFTEINRTNLSFSIKGSIKDVIPSRISQVVKAMKESGVDDLIKLGKRNREHTFLQDFFHRDELYLVLNRSATHNKNKILAERLYLARLLLTDETIKLDDLLRRFGINREYNYEMKKRVLDDGVKEWIAFTGKFTRDEDRVCKFFRNINKIKD